MLLSLKILVLDDSKKAFSSPVVAHGRKEYLWTADRRMIAECDKCNPGFSGDIGKDCTCGLYSSPNFEAIAEYDHSKNAILCLLNLYGTVDIWYGPEGRRAGNHVNGDLTHTFVLRSWGARIIGLVDRGLTEVEDSWWFNHSVASTVAAEILNVQIYSKDMVTSMIDKTWMDTVGYKPERKPIWQ
jgi:hypothetical protein